MINEKSGYAVRAATIQLRPEYANVTFAPGTKNSILKQA
jgi:hypothetical protein